MASEYPELEPRNRADREELRRYDLISSISSAVIEELDKRLERRLAPMASKVEKLWDERNEDKGARGAERRYQAVLVAVATIVATLFASVLAVFVQLWLTHQL